jgi:2-polyprenyl-6-methoxyphenol hydroxylase-like FAD-dependent oxidoreductase
VTAGSMAPALMNHDPSEPTHDVVISGAGPVGLFLACELALAKCSVLILEKTQTPHSPLKQLPFGIRGLSALSVEALYRRGLLGELEVPKRLKDPHSNAVQGPRRRNSIPFRQHRLLLMEVSTVELYRHQFDL